MDATCQALAQHTHRVSTLEERLLVGRIVKECGLVADGRRPDSADCAEGPAGPVAALGWPDADLAAQRRQLGELGADGIGEGWPVASAAPAVVEHRAIVAALAGAGATGQGVEMSRDVYVAADLVGNNNFCLVLVLVWDWW